MTQTPIIVEPVRVTLRRRGTDGLVVTIAVDQPLADLAEVVKIDAFGRAHWHLYTRDHQERVESLDGIGALRGGQTVLDQLPEHFVAAGHPDAAAQLTPDAHAALNAHIWQVVNRLTND